MNCEQVQSLLVSYLDREITPSEHSLLQAHLSGCNACREELTRISQVREQLGAALQRRAARAEPSAEAWERLQARLAQDAQPAPTQSKTWLSRLALGVSRKFKRQVTGGATMRKQSYWIAALALLSVVTITALILNNVVNVSAQTIIARASAAQEKGSTTQGVRHTLLEIYQNPLALPGEQAGTTITNETYEDIASGKYRFVSQDVDGKILQAYAEDGSYSYSFEQIEDASKGESLVLWRTSLDARKENTDAVTAQSIFEQFRSNPRVELLGKQTRPDGRQVYVLIDRNYQTEKQAGGDEYTYLGSLTMVFDEQDYRLVESETTIYKEGQEITIEKVQFLLDEVLGTDTQVAWDLGDLPGATIIDAPADQETAQEALPEPISMQELATHSDTYALNTTPSGFTVDIIAAPGQPSDQPYTYEINYNGPAGENFGLQAFGVSDPGFIESNFNDGSYKAANGMVLNYSSSRPVGSEDGTSAILTTPGGVSFLLISTLSREEVQVWVEDLVPLQ